MMTETQAKPSEILRRVWDKHGLARFDARMYWKLNQECGCVVGNLAIELGCSRPRTLYDVFSDARYYRTILDASVGLTLEEIKALEDTFEEAFRTVRHSNLLASREQAIAEAVKAAIAYLEGIGR